MSRYIDADAIHEKYDKYANHSPFGRGHGKTLARFLDWIDEEPTADVVEVKHGEWISLHNGRYKCSCCGMDWRLIGSPEANGMYYCLNCGAKMEVEDAEIY